MSFMIRTFEEGQQGMVACCDVCGKECCKADNALVCWHADDTTKHIKFNITHKGNCFRVLEHKHGKQYTHELDVALIYLTHNARVDFTRAARCAKLMADI